MTCELCTATEKNTRRKSVHERLLQVDMTERVSRSARKVAWVTRFQCQLCGTHWRHEHDMHNNQAEWSREHCPATVE